MTQSSCGSVARLYAISDKALAKSAKSGAFVEFPTQLQPRVLQSGWLELLDVQPVGFTQTIAIVYP